MSWSGQDDPGGSGIGSYSIYVSDNGGPYTIWQADTTQTSATFSGVYGNTYAFYSIATDNVGNVQPTPSAAQATTYLASPPTSAVNPLPTSTTSPTFVVSWSGSPGPGATSIASYRIFVSADGGSFQPFLTGTTQTSAAFTGQVGHTYSFYSVATNNVGLVQPTPTAPQATIQVAVTPPPLVTTTGVQDMMNKKHQVTEVLVTFSGPVNAAEAGSISTYHLATPGKKGSFAAKNAGTIKLKSAMYTAASHEVALIPKKSFALTKPVQVLVYGTPPSGLQDTDGRYIDGADNGQAGSNAAAILTKKSVTIEAAVLARTDERTSQVSAATDAILERGELTRTKHSSRAELQARAFGHARLRLSSPRLSLSASRVRLTDPDRRSNKHWWLWRDPLPDVARSLDGPRPAARSV